MPEITGCLHGYPAGSIGKCQFYKAGAGEPVKAATAAEVAQLIPWAGISLGQRDIAELAASRNLSVFGVIGMQNSGKTTLLTLLYCLLRQGHSIGDYQFSGSLTLPAWETLAYYMTWKAGNYITFPPHTPGSTGRIPGMLHLTLKNGRGHIRDILITDAKGEWFRDWSVNVDAETAKSPTWIHETSNAFVLVADCDVLSGPDRGIARDELKNLFNRLKNGLGSRTVALSWTKSDIVVRPAMKDNLMEHLQIQGIPLHQFMVSAYSQSDEHLPADHWQQQVLDLFEYLLKETENKSMQLPVIGSKKPKDLFLSIRHE